jgi:site-specific recombinase XerD
MSGADLYTVQKLLGHSKPCLEFTFYTHFIQALRPFRGYTAATLLEE